MGTERVQVLLTAFLELSPTERALFLSLLLAPAEDPS